MKMEAFDKLSFFLNFIGSEIHCGSHFHSKKSLKLALGVKTGTKELPFVQTTKGNDPKNDQNLSSGK